MDKFEKRELQSGICSILLWRRREISRGQKDVENRWNRRLKSKSEAQEIPSSSLSNNEHELGILLNWKGPVLLFSVLDATLFTPSISFSRFFRCRIGTHWLSVSPPILRNYALAAMLPAESLLGLSWVLGCNPSLIIRYKFKSSHG